MHSKAKQNNIQPRSDRYSNTSRNSYSVFMDTSNTCGAEAFVAWWQSNMTSFDITSIALKWYFFASSSFTLYNEFCHVFMKQLGLNAQQIGITNLFGVQHLFIPFILYLGDRFRARSLVIWIVSSISVVNCLLPLLPLVVSLPTCFETKSVSKRSINSTIVSESSVPWTSNLFFVMTISRTLVTFLEGVAFPLASLATISYLGNKRSRYGAYYMWKHFGTGSLIGFASVLAWAVRIKICGKDGYGYFTSFLLATIFQALAMLSLPCFNFKYETDRTINWEQVKSVVFNGHYIYMFLMTFYLGACVAFQVFWEFWYLDGLDASPLIMGGAALVRRPVLAVFIYTSCYVIEKVGDLRTICISFLLFALAFLALSFTRVYWYVLFIDMFHSAGYGLAYSAFTVHFSKAGSKASSGVILGLEETFFMVGLDGGASFLGVLFHVMGTRLTLITYGVLTAVMLIILLLYTTSSKKVKEYEKLPVDEYDSDENEKHDDDGNDKHEDGGNDKHEDGGNDKHEKDGNDEHEDGGNDKHEDDDNDKHEKYGNDKHEEDGNDKHENNSSK